MIEKLELYHWRSHYHSTLEFRKGTNVLVGVMGSGKSSLVDAICFGLFGTFPNLQNRKVSIEETIQQKPTTQDHAKVLVTFSYQNKQYQVERCIYQGNKASEAKLYCEGRLIAGPKPSEVTERVERELQLTYSLFSRAIYAEQNQLDFFLRLTPRERKQKFDELLEIDRYETVRQNAVSVQNRLKKRFEDQQRLIKEQEQRQYAVNTENVKTKIREKQSEQRQLAERFEHWKKNSQLLQQQLAELEEREKKSRQLADKELQCKTRIESLEHAIQKIGQNLENKTSTQIENEIKQAQEIEQQLHVHVQTLEKQQKEFSLQLNEVLQKQKVLENKQQETSEAVQQIESLQGRCPLCQRDLADHDKNQLVSELKTNNHQYQLQIQQYKLKIVELREKEEQCEQEKYVEQERLRKHIQQRSTLELQLHQAKRIREYEESLSVEKQEYEKVKKQQNESPFDADQLHLLRQQLLDSKLQENTNKQENQKCIELIASWNEQLRQMEAIQQQLEDLQKENRQLEDTLEKLGFFTNALQTVQSLLREQLLHAINQAMDLVWKKTYPYTDIQTAQLMIEEGNYEIKVKTQRGEWLRVEGNLSGGERSTVALCIRMAFSLVLTQNVGWMILDEPTHNLDRKAVDELGRLLKEQLPGLVEQTFVITHDPSLENAATGSLYEIVRDKNNDGASQPRAKN